MSDGLTSQQPAPGPARDEIPLLEDVVVLGENVREKPRPSPMEKTVEDLWEQLRHQVIEGVKRALDEAAPGICSELRGRLAALLAESSAADPADPPG